MKWSLRIGRIAGIDLFVHATFLILVVWLAASQILAHQSISAVIGAIGFVLLLFVIIILHELGHALAARRYGIETRDITLLPIGGVARLDRMPEQPSQELVVAFAGPLVNVVIAAGIFIGVAVTLGPAAVFDVSLEGGNFMVRLLWVNLWLAFFNLLPAFPMDGGRVLRALLAFRLGRERATEIAVNVGHAMALVFGFIGLVGWLSPVLVFIALFVWIGADGELQQVRMHAFLRGIPAAEVMATAFESVKAETTLAEVSDRLVPGFQTEFPVFEGSRLLGFIGLEDIVRGIAERGGDAPAGAIARTDFATAAPEDDLEKVVAEWQQPGGGIVAVVSDGALRGLITPANIGEHMMIRAALSRRGPQRR